MKTIIAEIKQDIRNHTIVKYSALINISIWKRAHYIHLSKIISQALSQSEHLKGERKFELGNSISYITLQRFFEDNYRNSAIHDLRFLKTLHKLCIFLGYYDLNEYTLHSNKFNTLEKTEEEIKPFKELIENFCKAEFAALQKLPNIEISSLYQYAFEESNVIMRIKDYMTKYQKGNYYFDKEYTDSTFELLHCEFITDEKEIKVLKAHENWDLVLKNDEGKVMFYKVINYQSYFIKKDKNNVWKIWDNHNPNLQKVITSYI